MEWIDYIAFNRNIRSEEPNKELAKELVEAKSKEGICEIADHLYDKNKSIASDCIAVLYHVGYLEPSLISDYAETFLALLKSKNNRMVWGGMIALSTITELKSDYIFSNIDLIIDKTKNGSLITQIHGINTLIRLSLYDKKRKEQLFPILLEYLETCRPIDFPKRVDLMLPVIENEIEKEIFENIINKKASSLSESQKKKLNTIINRYNKKSNLIILLL